MVGCGPYPYEYDILVQPSSITTQLLEFPVCSSAVVSGHFATGMFRDLRPFKEVDLQLFMNNWEYVVVKLGPREYHSDMVAT